MPAVATEHFIMSRSLLSASVTLLSQSLTALYLLQTDVWSTRVQYLPRRNTESLQTVASCTSCL